MDEKIAQLIELVDEMWDDELLSTTQSGEYYKKHKSMRGHWKNADEKKQALRAGLVALGSAPAPAGGTFGSGDFANPK